MLSLILLLSLTSTAEVRVSNSHLVVTCVAGQSVANTPRRWNLAQPTAFTFTMRNQPRPGIENREPGLAVISFTPQAGHEYEIEVRSDASAFSRRVWTKGEWKPVVRDRTTDRIVSSEPVWIERGCAE
ncbi:MAG TPA: hypothetical protein VEA16_00755 [Vicinamibacterales bacterium]|nr:hypothetical protein [Vicinamibacterales bacterium]